ncbi:60S acidic ribosomal protein P2, partial [Moesziomyces antarcticus T-34]
VRRRHGLRSLRLNASSVRVPLLGMVE